jgi:hypothetical protein
MKTEGEKTRKQQQSKSSRNRPVCGTLSYLAECRGTAQKIGTSRLLAPPGDMSRIIRRYPAEE